MAANDEVTYTDADEADVTRACSRKRAYPTEAIAKNAVTAIRDVSPYAQVQTYGCRRCGHWHVGGTPRSEQVEMEAGLVVDDSFDAERARRRRGGPRLGSRKASGDGYRRRQFRLHERHEVEYD